MKVQIALRHSRGLLCSRYPQGTPKRKGKNGIGTVFGKKPNTSALIEKGPLDNMATKDKGKAAITAIKYSALQSNAFQLLQPPPTTLGMG